MKVFHYGHVMVISLFEDDLDAVETKLNSAMKNIDDAELVMIDISPLSFVRAECMNQIREFVCANETKDLDILISYNVIE